MANRADRAAGRAAGDAGWRSVPHVVQGIAGCRSNPAPSPFIRFDLTVAQHGRYIVRMFDPSERMRLVQAHYIGNILLRKR
jgi:hypothetical protein